MALKEIKYTVLMIECERGWGSRVDGVKYFDTPEERDAFIKEYNTKYNNESTVPNWYIRAEAGSDKIMEPEIWNGARST